MKKKVKTIFDGTNEQVLSAFNEILQDVREIITDDEYPSILIMGVDENAPRAELGKAYVQQKVGERMYQLIGTFLRKKPDNMFNILDVIFCAEKGTYRKKSFKETMKDLTYLTKQDLADLLGFLRAVGLSK